MLSKVKLCLIGVFSVADRVERRMLLRSSYMRHTLYPIEFKFILGNTSSDVVLAEMNAYNDVVVLPQKENMNEGKSFYFFQWAIAQSYHHKFIAKMDDDVFFYAPNFLHRIRTLPNTNVYFGRPIPLGNQSSQPWFHQGMFYMFSRDLLIRIINEVKEHSSSQGEDVLAGRWMYQFGLPPKHWFNATPEEFYESMYSSSGEIGTPLGWWKRPHYTRQTIGIHLLKSTFSMLHAYHHFYSRPE